MQEAVVYGMRVMRVMRRNLLKCTLLEKPRINTNEHEFFTADDPDFTDGKWMAAKPEMSQLSDRLFHFHVIQLVGVNSRVMPFDLQKALSLSISACLGDAINALPS